MSQSSVDQGGAPAWLFSFVDLAFLMLIAMTLLASQNAGAPDLGEISVPRIGGEASTELAAGRGDVWQLRVHIAGAEAPFELLRTGTLAAARDGEGDGSGAAPRLDRDALRDRLTSVHADGIQKPLLAPHEDSRSQDLLDAASLIEELWPSPRRAVVARLVGR